MGLLNILFRKPQGRIDIVSLNRDLEILNDCAKLIENTVVPEVFFSRYDLYMEKLSILSCAESEKIITVTGESLSQKYKEMNTENKRIEVVNNFIDRMRSDAYDKAQKLKTEKGKKARFEKFYSTLSEYENQMPEQCTLHYKSFDFHSDNIKPRNTITADTIDKMQRIEASAYYKNKIYQKFYSDYREMPYISQDRELNTNWLEQAALFPQQSIIQKAIMIRYKDGLLPGHIYMLYWLGKYENRRIPAYFEYKYGIEFVKEKQFLIEHNYLENDKPTEKGKKAISKHKEIIDNHSTKRE